MHFTNKYNLPKSFTDIIDKRNYDITKSDPNRISLTTLTQPPIIRQLNIRHWHELVTDYADKIWQIGGNAYHYILAKTEEDNRRIEQKIEIPIKEFTLVCKPDFYDKITKELEDWKITSVWAVKEIKQDWIDQLNGYAWALRVNDFPVEKLFINAILRDWRKAELKKYGNDYPLIPFKRMSIPLWAIEKQDDFIFTKINEYSKVRDLPTEELPICSPEDRWKTKDVYAVYKGKNKNATKLCKSTKEAEKYIIDKKIKDSKINLRPGTDIKCNDYCSCNKFCPYWRKTYGNTKT